MLHVIWDFGKLLQNVSDVQKSLKQKYKNNRPQNYHSKDDGVVMCEEPFTAQARNFKVLSTGMKKIFLEKLVKKAKINQISRKLYQEVTAVL